MHVESGRQSVENGPLYRDNMPECWLAHQGAKLLRLHHKTYWKRLRVFRQIRSCKSLPSLSTKTSIIKVLLNTKIRS